MERIFSRPKKRDPTAEFKELNDFVESISHLPIDEAEQKIAEDKFRRPIVIFNALAIRPFWRDGRKAPPLPWEDNNGKIIKGHKTSSPIVGRGH